jgi:hypothetical protein
MPDFHDPPTAEPLNDATPAAVTEAMILGLLHKRYTAAMGMSRRYAVANHVGTSTGGAQHIADCVVFDLWPSKLEFHGFEIKCSRSDWLSELKNPHKADSIKRYMTTWSLVVAKRDIVKVGELPPGWGLLVVSGASLRTVTSPPTLHPDPMPLQLTAAFARALQRTAAAPESIEFQKKTYDAQFTQLGAVARHYEGVAAQERRASTRYRNELQTLREKIRELDPDYFRK